MHEIVKDYYGKQLQSSDDLKASFNQSIQHTNNNSNLAS